MRKKSNRETSVITDSTYLLIASFALFYAAYQSFVFLFNNIGETKSFNDLMAGIFLPFAAAAVLGISALIPLFTLYGQAPTLSYALAGVWQCFVLFFPALCANQCAGFARKWRLPLADRPISVAKLGPSKTWGQLYAPLGAFAGLAIQVAMPFMQSNLVDYHDSTILVAVGLASGIGAPLGDVLESYFKRRRNKESGEPWIPWDQTDFAIVSGILLFFVLGSSVIHELMGYLVMMLFLHPIGNSLGWKLGLRKRVL